MQHVTSTFEPGAGPRHFYASPTSPLARSRRWLWVGLAAPWVVLWATGSRGPVLWITGLLLGLVGAVVHVLLTRQLRPGQPLVTVDDDGLASPLLPGPTHRYAWHEVLDVAAESVQGAPVLRLTLKPAAERPDKRRFWTGQNPARPVLALNALSPEDQVRLLDAIQRGISPGHGDSPGFVPLNALREEQRFEAELKARMPVPWACHAMAALNVLAWLGTVALGAGVMQVSAEQLLGWGGNAASEVQHGAWWRLLSATFLHSGALHLGMNMLGLYAIGVTVERFYGHRLFVLLYLASGLMGSALSLHFAAQRAVSVGASGAVFGLAGALLAVVLQHRRTLPQLFGKRTRNGMAFFIIYALIQGAGQAGIDNAAHIGGLLAGASLAWWLPERLGAATARRPLALPLLGGAVATLLGCWLLVQAAPKAERDMRQFFAGQAHFAEGMRLLDAALKGLQQEQQDMAAGKTTELQGDQRSRTVHAPAMRRALAELAQATLPPEDPRAAVLPHARRLAEISAEMLAMDSNIDPSTGTAEAARPERAQALEAELVQTSQALQRVMAGLGKR